MSYCGVSDVYIYLNRTSERLEDASKTAISPRRKSFSVPVRTHGKATVRKLLRQITVCPSIPTLSTYDLRLTYDVFNSPNGKSYPISQMLLFRTAENYIIIPSCQFVDPETGPFLNREDWGLTFELSNVTSHGATVTCTQSGGQQIGQLKINGYYISPDVGTAFRIAK